MHPLVSIIIPVYNGALTVARSIKSVARQTYQNIELFVINDGSTDDSECRIQNSELRTINYLKQENQGVVVARNNAFNHAKGKYIVFLDCGDELEKNYVSECVNVLENEHNIHWVYSVTLQISDKDGDFNRFWSFHEFDIYDNFSRAVQLVTSMMRRELFEDLGGFDPDFQHGYEDWAFWVKACRLGYKGKLLKKVLFFYFKESQSRSNNLHQNMQYEYESKKLIISKNQECYNVIDTHLDKLLKDNLRIPLQCVNMKFRPLE